MHIIYQAERNNIIFGLQLPSSNYAQLDYHNKIISGFHTLYSLIKDKSPDSKNTLFCFLISVAIFNYFLWRYRLYFIIELYAGSFKIL